jgi:hypothetical protein
MTLPMMFREALASAGLRAIDEWWAHLDAPSRSEALQLWHECSQAESGLAVRVEARFAEDHEEKAGEFWHSDFYDYLVNHELYFFRERSFHICTRHPKVAGAVRAGFIPHDFTCPLESGDCAMRRLLALSPGKSVRLGVSIVAAERMPEQNVELGR